MFFTELFSIWRTSVHTGFQGNAWISLLSVSIQKNVTLLESVPCDTKAWRWQAGHFPSQGERKYKNGEEKRLWQGGLIKTTWSACSVPVYKWMALQRICLLDTSTMGHPAQTTGWRKPGTWRPPHTNLQTCEEIPMWQTCASLWPHNNLLWKHRWKDPWAHAAVFKNVLRASEAFRFKLRLAAEEKVCPLYKPTEWLGLNSTVWS